MKKNLPFILISLILIFSKSEAENLSEPIKSNSILLECNVEATFVNNEYRQSIYETKRIYKFYQAEMNVDEGALDFRIKNKNSLSNFKSSKKMVWVAESGISTYFYTNTKTIYFDGHSFREFTDVSVDDTQFLILKYISIIQ